MTTISTRVISRPTGGPRPPLVQLDNQYPSLSARSPDSIRRSVPPARSASSAPPPLSAMGARDRKSTRLNSSHLVISYAVFCLKKKNRSVTSHVVSLTAFHD